jgi:hypothetical protein
MSTSTPQDSSGAADVPRYTLGPQPDDSIVLRIQNDFDLMVLRKAVEKQQKNAGAATGTVSALADGDDPFVDAVQRALDRLHKSIITSRAPDDQIADTPIGQAIRAAADEPREQIDGQPEGVTWAPDVPRPRPALGQMIEWPSGETFPIREVCGFDPVAGMFQVADGNAMRLAVVGHQPSADHAVTWRVATSDNYPTPTVAPSSRSPGDDLVDAAQAGTDNALWDGAPGVEDEEEGGTPSGTDADDAPIGTGADGEPQAVAPADKPKRPSGGQRERNQRAAGVKPRGGKRGGRS